MKRLLEGIALATSVWSWVALKVWLVPLFTAAYYGVCGTIKILEYIDNKRKQQKHPNGKA